MQLPLCGILLLFIFINFLLLSKTTLLKSFVNNGTTIAFGQNVATDGIDFQKWHVNYKGNQLCFKYDSFIVPVFFVNFILTGAWISLDNRCTIIPTSSSLAMTPFTWCCLISLTNLSRELNILH